MKKLLLLSALLIFSNGNSQTIQRLDKIYESYSILNEDFLKPLLLEHKEKYKKGQLVVNDSLKRVALKRALNDCQECFIHNPNYAKNHPQNKNNPFKINFVNFISHNNFYLKSNQMFTITRLFESMAPLLQVKPELLDNMNVDETFRYFHHLLDAPPQILNEKEQVEQERQARQEAQQQMMEAEQAKMESEAGKNVADANLAQREANQVG